MTAGTARLRGAVLAAAVSVGVACLVVFGLPGGAVTAAVACPATAVALTMLARLPARRTPDPGLALVLDLIAAGLRSGQPPDAALSAVCGAARPALANDLRRLSGLLRLGAEPAQAWQSVARAGPLEPVVAVAVRSAHSGIRTADAFERLAVQLREQRVQSATSRAHRAGVRSLGPLAVCFLPSFVCLGVAPVVVGMVSTALQH